MQYEATICLPSWLCVCRSSFVCNGTNAVTPSHQFSSPIGACQLRSSGGTPSRASPVRFSVPDVCALQTATGAQFGSAVHTESKSTGSRCRRAATDNHAVFSTCEQSSLTCEFCSRSVRPTPSPAPVAACSIAPALYAQPAFLLCEDWSS